MYICQENSFYMNLKTLIGTLVSCAILFFLYKAFIAPSGEEVRPGHVFSIADLKKDVRAYDGKIVSIKGQVIHSGGFGVSGYTIEDGTGKITVLSTKAAPNKGDTYKVKGKLNEVLKVGNESQLTITEKDAERVGE